MISEVELAKEEKTSLSSQPLSLSSLPDEIIENILARISKWTYPNLSLVSKRFLSLLSSTNIYRTRSNLGTTEACLYLHIESSKHAGFQWFNLWMKPDGDILNDYSLIRLPSSCQSHPPLLPFDSIVAVGSEIYVIGGTDNMPSSALWILDCQSNTWREGPDMTVARVYPVSALFDQEIYVMGGSELDESDIWCEVFDIKTQTWRALPSPNADHKLWRDIKVNPYSFDGKLYVAANTKDYAYEPKDGTWEVVREVPSKFNIIGWCVIENVMYCWTREGYLQWYDSESREWRDIKGLEELRKQCIRGYVGYLIAIVNCTGKLVVMWCQGQNEKEQKIWCTKIALERHRDEIWGKTEWLIIVFTLPTRHICSTCRAVSI